MSDAAKRPMPSRDELRDWRDYIETSQLVNSMVAAQLQAHAGISTADYSVMLALNEAEARTLRSSKLAEDMGWDRSRLSHQLGRMEKRGLIRREKCAEDSRGSHVVLTDEGYEVYRKASIEHLRDVREYFIAALSPQQLSALGEASAALRAHLDERRGEIAACENTQ